MDFSDEWRSLWPIAGVPHAPNLLSGYQTTHLGPLLFHPSSPHRILLASSSLALRITPSSPPSILEGIQSFFRCPNNGSFISAADQYNLAADVISSLTSTANDSLDPLSYNNLHTLLCRDGSSLLLFFPTGENSDEIGFLCLRFGDESLKPDVGVDLDGCIFKQREGMKHPCHRILRMLVVSSQTDSSSPMDNSVTEGFLMATTLYSVNWFRVETRVSDEGIVRHLLVPLAKQGFSSCVVDACWSSHFPEESAVLLETGELFWFNLISKRGGTHRVSIGNGRHPGRFLGCKFGGQPWVILVACSISVVLIDLRPKRITEEPKILAKVQLPDCLGVVSMDEKDTFQVFCGADFSDFHFTVVTDRLLLLFDMRQPLVPVLTWDHGLDHPIYASMFRLSELRPSEEFKCVSESGFVILVGSFWKNEFKLFCYGSSDRGVFGSSFYAWELPSSLSLSGRQWSSADSLVREMMLKEKLPNQEMLLRKEGVAGFCVVPNVLLKSRPKPSGFVLIRLMFSGKLEMQEFHSCISQNENPICQGEDMQEAEDFTICNTYEGSSVYNRFRFFKFCYLFEYMKENLYSALSKRHSEMNHKAKKRKFFSDDLGELLSSKLQSSSIPISTFIADVSIPTNVFEVASQKILTTLQPDILSLAFTKYEELFPGHAETSPFLLEFPKCLFHHRFPHFFVSIPSQRSEFLPRKVLTGEAIIGPVLPLPVLLVLQQMGLGRTEFSNKEKKDGDLLTLECKGVLDNVFLETSIADSGGFSESFQEFQDDKHFFVYQPRLRGCRTIFKDTICTSPNKDAQSKMDHLSECNLVPENILNDEKFTTFICGNSDKNCHLNCESGATNPDFFDVSPVKLDFESLDIILLPKEHNYLNSLKRQASKWLENNKSYQDFCTSSKISKPIL